ncbi:MAG: hypothetical protein IPO65_18150 [Saprospiraceae bacterium]|nr:hypothetical protein [Saprospiraceae bacterium]
MNIQERQQIVLAALLHDIGKFWERADEKYNTSDTIRKEFPNGEYTHTLCLFIKMAIRNISMHSDTSIYK